MTAILKRELKEYFYTPIGYVFIGFFIFLTSWIFTYTNIFSASGDLSSLFGNLTIVFMFLVPILTMRLISEEKNTKTDQLLLTAPISITKIVLGKVFAAFSVFLISLLLSLVYPVIISIYSKPAVSEIAAVYIGFFLMGISYISIGVFISSLTENQIISAVSTFVILFVLNLADMLTTVVTNPFLKSVISYLSVTTRYTDFTNAIVRIDSVIYYLSVSALFIFLTGYQIEKRRFKK